MRGESGGLRSMSRKIAVVEDEAELASLIEYNLARGGFDVKLLNGAAQTLAELESWKPDLIVLDVMLPGQDGFDLCRQIRQTGKLASTPIIFLTARSDEVDRVLGLEIGAADYVTKPYRLRELVARMRAVLRRPIAAASSEVVTFGDLRVDVARRTVSRRGRDVELSRKEFDLLALFASRLGQVVTREVCLDTLWWGLELSDTRTLDTHVKRLRQKIEDDPASPRHLLTIRGVGFRLDP